MKKYIFYIQILILFIVYSCNNYDMSNDSVGYLKRLSPGSTFSFIPLVDGNKIDSLYILQPYSYEDLKKRSFDIPPKIQNRLKTKASFDNICVLIFIHDKRIIGFADVPRGAADFADISPALFSINQLFYLDNQKKVKLFSRIKQ
ncbi:hypothetical protein ACTMKN_02300 [Bacteroides pyogenes]|jgi:hypothetical protein|uniref:Uncharacterized protein n=2 Tax=Bacteroides pyogenes TaxID=310300 RepID=W4PLG6_9BACE|nr:hypothetical protein [Bacteroides pyogenes]MDY4249255.1 hypothetical protein [Bacteroides pyogenes]TYK36818.1 hypothetical protein FNJ59_10920 [Bacteroides pyogenes]GAE17214.1 hypothetical protein JCM6292_3792 [Bacteroides pyogenes JCM 6292]GAE20607.1 hypothetical protein JCM6294_3849 [Bacteroides pyogenes DSM 20611 = JCM 6294]